MNKNVITIVVVLLVIIGASGIYLATREKAAENTIEAGIESAIGGQADVDLDDNTVTINTNAGTFQSGEATTLPDNFPSDVHVVDGDIMSATSFSEEGADAFTISIEPTKSMDDVKSEYESELVSDGWEITATLATGDLTTISAEKGDRTLAVSISVSDGKTLVVLSTSEYTE